MFIQFRPTVPCLHNDKKFVKLKLVLENGCRLHGCAQLLSFLQNTPGIGGPMFRGRAAGESERSLAQALLYDIG